MSEVFEAIVAHVDDLQNGEMREVEVGDTPVLLLKINNQYHALGAKCTHYGAPLAKGVLHGDQIICPWHHACFRAIDGALEQPPALDALPQYKVRVSNDNVLVVVSSEAPDRRTPAMAEAGVDTRVFLIVGGGAAGQNAAEQLRESGFRGKIVMLSAADQAPLDRTMLSKDFLDGSAKAEKLPLRPADFYAKHAIDVRTGSAVKRIDLDKRMVECADGTNHQADAILLAPGSTPIALDIPGAKLPQVVVLRQQSDAEQIVRYAEHAQRVIVVGASFIGMEAAASLQKRGLQVTVVAPEHVPYERVLGTEVGTMFLNLHAEQGVEFRLGRKLAQIEGSKHVTGVVLDDGEHLTADLVVVGIGVTPATKQIEGLPLEKDGGVKVDHNLRLADGVWAAGDVAHFPDVVSGKPARIEHWRLAEQHGRHAAQAMLGETAAFEHVPFFWTKQFGMSLRYVGHATQFDDVIYWGDPAARDFLALYVEDGRVAAAAGVKRDPAMAAIHVLMHENRMPAPGQLRNGEVDLQAML